MRSVDLLVIPSAPGEATTRVILEAYAAGIPVVASDSGGTSEVISDGETGFLVPASDPVKLAAKIRDVMVQPALRERVARNARCAWSKHYTLAGYQARVLSILESVGANART